MSATGLQPDGSYTPCPDCRYEPPVYDGPGDPVRTPGTIHRSDCPTIAFIFSGDSEAAKRLQADLDAIRECHRQAWRDMQGVVIG